MFPVIILFLTIIFQASTQTLQEHPVLKVIVHMPSCAKELGVNNAILNQFTNVASIRNMFTNEKEIDRDVKCMMNCMLRKGKYIVNKKINVKGTDVYKSRGSVLDIQKCVNINESDECELAYKVGKCIVEEVATKIKN